MVSISVKDWMAKVARRRMFLVSFLVTMLSVAAMYSQITSSVEMRLLRIQLDLGTAIKGIERELAVDSDTGVTYVLRFLEETYLSGGQADIVKHDESQSHCSGWLSRRSGLKDIVFQASGKVCVYWPLKEMRSYGLVLTMPIPIEWPSLLFAVFVILVGMLVTHLDAQMALRFLQKHMTTPLVRFAGDKLDSIHSDKTESGFRLKEIQAIHDALLRLRTREQEALEAAQDRAIAQMTKMLAHDVRKPFSMMRAALSVLESFKSIDQLRLMIPSLKKSITRSMRSVNDMLGDIMQVGQKTALAVQSHQLQDLLNDSLTDLANLNPDAQVEIEFDLRHTRACNVDSAKIQRVLGNILGNAVQAMKGKGRLMITSESLQQGDKGLEDLSLDHAIRLRITNTGSWLSFDKMSKVFDAFYTSDKSGGTGLGLAIAKKFVLAHRGSIDVSSDQAVPSVTFTLLLPCDEAVLAVDVPAQRSALLSDFLELHQPGNSVESTVASASERGHPFQQLSDEDKLRVDTLAALSKTLSRPLQFLIIDDESVYASAFQTLCKHPLLQGSVRVTHLSSPLEFFQRKDWSFDFVVSDIDLHDCSHDGLDLVAFLRKQGLKAPICVSSNRVSQNDAELAFASGADFVFPKPLALGHILKATRDLHKWV